LAPPRYVHMDAIVSATYGRHPLVITPAGYWQFGRFFAATVTEVTTVGKRKIYHLRLRPRGDSDTFEETMWLDRRNLFVDDVDNQLEEGCR
jgi:hypothetical protein